MATDEQRERDEQALVLRNEIMQKIQRGEPFTVLEEAMADDLGIRVPTFLRPGAGADLEAAALLDTAIEEQTGLHPAEPEPELEPEPPAAATHVAEATGEEWLGMFYSALAELWASAGWLPFAMGQLGAAVQGDVDDELLDAMFTQAADDIAGLAGATKTIIEVSQQGLTNLQARRAL